MNPFFLALLTVLFWAGIPVAGKLALETISGFQLLLYLFLFSSLAMAAIVVLKKKTGILFGYAKKDYARMVLLGSAGWFGLEVFYYYGLVYAPAVGVSILNSLWPVFAVILAHFSLGERMNGRKFFAVALAFFGAAVVIGLPLPPDIMYLFGYSLAVLSGIAEAFFLVGGKKYGFEEYSSMLVYSLTAFFLSLGANFFNSSLFIPSLSELASLLYLGVFGAALSYTFLIMALERGDTAKVVTFTYLAPFLALVLISVFLHEAIPLSAVGGLALITGGILLQNGGKDA